MGTTTSRAPRAAGSPADGSVWRAITSRDARADGRFVYAVRTTGVFCRPSCPSRQPLRANVRVFPDGAAARAGGFRACLRCRPGESRRAPKPPPSLSRACLMLAEEPPARCEDVAAALALSPAALTRLFRTHLGVTPTAYRRRVRAERGREALVSSGSVTEAVYGAGFSGPSRFYAALAPELGMAPSRARRGGEGERIAWVTRACTLGRVLVAWTERGVAAVTLGDDDDTLAQDLRARFPHAELEPGGRRAPPWLAAVLAAVEGQPVSEEIPRAARGTAFQERVWRALAAIPEGETRSYVELARALGEPRHARAVARACATNGLAVVVPCHRAVRAGGALAGYRWGLDKKRALLARESGAAARAAAERDRVARRPRA